MLISTSLLTGVLALAVWTDLKSRRIPNALVAMGLCLALASVPMGWGSVSLSQCLLGALTGLVLFLPLYLFGAVGAGDAKLMAAVGAFVGPYAVLWAAVYTALFGGVMSIVTLMAMGVLRESAQHLWVYLRALAVRFAGVGAPTPSYLPTSNARMPYALAIGAGTLGWFQLGPLLG
jgi:prepilin peptidase CpaA